MQNPWEKWIVNKKFQSENVKEKDYVNLDDERIMNLKYIKGSRVSG